MAVFGELNLVKFSIAKVQVVILKVEHGGVVGRVEYRSARLYLEGSLKFVRSQLFGDVKHYAAFYTLVETVNVVSPCRVVHELVDGCLERLKNSAISALNFLGVNLHVAP